MKKLLGVVVIVLLWQLGASMTTPLFIPPPADVWVAFCGLLENNQLCLGLLYSFARITTATMLSVVCAVPMALLVCSFRALDDIISPITSAMRYIPVTAFSPLLILWFGIDEEMKVSFLFLATFVYVLPTTVLCLKDVPQDLIDTGKSIGMRSYEIIYEILLPSALPSITNSILMMYGIGWTYIAVIEAVNAKYGLGYIINTAAARGKTAVVFAAIIAIVVFSYVFDKAGNALIRTAFRWRHVTDDSAE